MARLTRGYSRDFTPRTTRRVQLTINRVPPRLLDRVRAKAKRERISVRALVLGQLRRFLTEGVVCGAAHAGTGAICSLPHRHASHHYANAFGLRWPRD